METLTQALSQEALLGTRIGEVYKAESYEIETQFQTAEQHDECAPVESGLCPAVQPSSLPVTVYMENMAKEHILVVDDEQNMLNTLAFILESANYQVTTAAEGREALEEILAARENGRPVDLLITDLRLPGLTGLQLIDELNYLKIKIPVLLITAYGNRSLFRELKRVGCADYLDKPFDYKELVKRVDSLVEQKITG
jgi:CheY-like chemotaxis protein